jgi:hypothetical protein
MHHELQIELARMGKVLRQLVSDVQDIKAILAQLKPHDFSTALEQGKLQR